jgi:hypothetical protein
LKDEDTHRIQRIETVVADNTLHFENIPSSKVAIVSICVWSEHIPVSGPTDHWLTMILAPEQPHHLGPHGGLSTIQRLEVDPELASLLVQVTEHSTLYSKLFTGVSEAIKPFSRRCTVLGKMELNVPDGICSQIIIDTLRTSTTCEGGFDNIYCPVTMKQSVLTQCNHTSLIVQELVAPLWQPRSKSLWGIYNCFYKHVLYAVLQVAHEREITLGRRHEW